MKAKLKYIHSPDVENMEEFLPNSEDPFCFLAQLIVESVELGGEESFDVQVCNPKWIEELCAKQTLIIGHGLIIMSYFQYELFFRRMDKYISSCSGDKWESLALKISRIATWEFENYSD